MYATQKTRKSARVEYGKTQITAWSAAMWTAAAFQNAQTMRVTQKTSNGATTVYGKEMITAAIAETGIYHAELHAAAISAIQHQTRDA